MDDCIRRAWLTLGALSMPLEDESAGYYCVKLDLGYPDVRDVVNNRPDQHGIDDRTQFFGARVVSADIVATGQPVDATATAFAPFMDPQQRPVLHYVLDTGPDSAERTLVVRASNYAWPLVGGRKREIQLQWVAADPVTRGALPHQAWAWAGTGILGRVYDLVPPRVYPVGAGLPSVGVIETDGDVAVRPLLHVFGPISNPVVTFDTAADPVAHYRLALPSYRIDAGRHIVIDTAAHTATDDHGVSILGELDWPTLSWPLCPPLPDSTTMAITGTGTTTSSQCQATWYDGYLS